MNYSGLGKQISRDEYYAAGNPRLSLEDAKRYNIDPGDEFDVARSMFMNISGMGYPEATQAAQKLIYGDVRSKRVARQSVQDEQAARAVPLSSPVNLPPADQAYIRQVLEGRIDPADIKRTIRTEKEIDRRLAAEAIIRELGLEAKAEPIIAELIQGPRATSTGQRLAAMQPAMNNIQPAQILALLGATGLGGGVTAALLNQGNQQQQEQPAMAAR